MAPTIPISQLAQSLYLLVITIGILTGIIIAITAWQRRRTPGARPYVGVALSSVAISIAFLGISLSTSSDIAWGWVKLKFLGLTLISGFFFLSCLEFTGHKAWIRPGLLGGLLIVPILVQGAVWSDPASGIFFRSWHFIRYEVIAVEQQTLTGIYWVHAAYFDILICLSTGLVIHYLLRSGVSQRVQIGLVILGGIGATVIGQLSTIMPTLVPLNLVPISVMIVVLDSAWLLFRQRLFDVVPIAYDMVFASMRDAVIILDSREHIVKINQQAELFLSQTRDEVLGKPIGALLIGRRLIEERDRLIQKSFELSHQNRAYEVDFSRLETTQNELAGYVIILHDISVYKERDTLKNQMIQMVSHDLKNPIGLILGYADLMLMGLEKEDSDKAIRVIRESAVRMQTITTELLNLERLKSGQLTLTEFDLGAFLRALVVEYQRQAADQQQSLSLSVPGSVVPIYADKPQLHEAISNLVGNALKYTPPGGKISVSLATEDRHAKVTITDNGYGMSKDAQVKLFQPFYRIYTKATATITGTGLGLSLVKAVIDAHKGEITVDSDEGKGSTFRVTIPINNIPEPR